MWISRSLLLTTCHWWEEKKRVHQLLDLQTAHTACAHILLARNDNHIANPKHKGNQGIYSSCGPRKKMKQIYGEQLAVTATHPFSRMN